MVSSERLGKPRNERNLSKTSSYGACYPQNDRQQGSVKHVAQMQSCHLLSGYKNAKYGLVKNGVIKKATIVKYAQRGHHSQYLRQQ